MPCVIIVSMIAETIPELRSLSSDQKIILAAELWRDAVEQVSSWEAVRERIASGKTSLGMREVVWTRAAEADLQAAYERIEESQEGAARAFCC